MSWHYIGRKVGGSLLTLAFVVVFNFFLFRVINDDPVGSLFRGRRVPQAKVDELRAQFGLDDSMWRQFWLYLRETAQFNFGLSYQTRQPVWDEISGKIWPTVLLVGVSAILSAVFGVIGGIIAAWRRGSAADSVDLVLHLDDQPLGSLLADAGNALQGGDVGTLDQAREIVDRGARKNGQRGLGAHAGHLDQGAEQAALRFLGEAVERVRVFLDRQMDVQRHFAAQFG